MPADCSDRLQVVDRQAAAGDQIIFPGHAAIASSLASLEQDANVGH